MENIIVIILIIFVILYLLSKDSNKETKKERYGDAVGELAHMTANSVSCIARSMTETSKSKDVREARNALASRNGELYRFKLWYGEDELKRLLTVDSYFKKSLDVLNLTSERWRKIGLKIFYLGVIKKEARDCMDYSQKLPKPIRRHIIEENSKDENLKIHPEYVRKACDYFHIPIEEWIEYGDAVIEMHDLLEDQELQEFGDIVKILPNENNSHLL